MEENMYSSEEEFLKNYDSSQFEKLSMTADILITSVSDEETDNYRKLGEKKFSILLIKRDTYPFKDKWCLPGGFIKMDETLDEAAKRILKNETNLTNIYLEQLYTFSNVDRDPRMRIVSTAYIALIDKNKLKNNLSENTSWFNVDDVTENDKEVKIRLNNGKEIIDFTINKQNSKILKNKKLAFDHPIVISTGLERIKNKIEYTDIVFNMMPEYFTLTELQKVYEVILNKKLLPADFRRKISSKVEKTEKVQIGKGHRPSILYRKK